MLALPQQFDANEWFIIISLIAGYGTLYVLPRRFPMPVTILVLMFSLTIVRVTDYVAAAPPLNLYQMNDTQKFELMDLLGWFMFPPFGYVLVYCYDRWNIQGVSSSLYIVAWTVIALAIERLAVTAHIYTFTGWKTAYSIPTYLAVLSGYLLLFHFVKNRFYQLKKG